jgi:hypothetical protein
MMKSKNEILEEHFKPEFFSEFEYIHILEAMDTYASELKQENERLRGLLEKMVRDRAFNAGHLWECKTDEDMWRQMDAAWQQFAADNNIKL